MSDQQIDRLIVIEQVYRLGKPLLIKFGWGVLFFLKKLHKLYSIKDISICNTHVWVLTTFIALP